MRSLTQGFAACCRVSTFAPELLNEYAHGPPPLFGLCCGWHNLDRLYQVSLNACKPGLLYMSVIW